jgi:hypothetical protein
MLPNWIQHEGLQDHGTLSPDCEPHTKGHESLCALFVDKRRGILFESFGIVAPLGGSTFHQARLRSVTHSLLIVLVPL